MTSTGSLRSQQPLADSDKPFCKFLTISVATETREIKTQYIFWVKEWMESHRN